ncbi:MAG: hypothetical protein CSA81_04420 [Acidobacteria bacterium]|nr:MAG: hypothetical protein CSA81_04420 [Acidobacteriota bacterium]
MFDPAKAKRLSIPQWEAVYRSEIVPGVVSFVAIHDTTRGRALGGCRMAKYESEALAMTDVLRLSRGMTFKNAVADLPLGGGKSIIVCDPSVEGVERARILEEFGKFIAWVNSKQDRYYTAEDMNTTVPDMHIVKKHTKNIFGIDVDPSPYTAEGVFQSIKYAVDYFAIDFFHAERTLKGRTVLVQGLGKVGQTLIDKLYKAGAKLYINDINEASIKKALEKYPEAVVVPAEEVISAKVDIFAPCAKGEVVTKHNVKDLNCKILCGAANNVLQNSKIGVELQRRGIVYCPDYVANMGGVCSIQYIEVEKLSDDKCIDNIGKTVRKMLGLTFRTAFRNNMPFNLAVDHAVKKMIWGGDKVHKNFNNETYFPHTAAAEPH